MITQRAEGKKKGKVEIALFSSSQDRRTPHSLHDGSEHEASTSIKHQNFAACVDVRQSQHLGERVVPQVAASHEKHTHHLFLPHKNTTFTDILLNRCAASPDLPRFPAVVHHSEDATGRSYNRHSIFIPGAAQDGKRPITLITARSIIFLSLQRDGGRIIRSDSLLLFLLDVLILGVFRLIFER